MKKNRPNWIKRLLEWTHYDYDDDDDEAREDIWVGLRKLGIIAKLAPRGCLEEKLDADVGTSKGVIYVTGSPIKWVNDWEDVHYPTYRSGGGIG